jgi:hypothetical protein
MITGKCTYSTILATVNLYPGVVHFPLDPLALPCVSFPPTDRCLYYRPAGSLVLGCALAPRLVLVAGIIVVSWTERN